MNSVNHTIFLLIFLLFDAATNTSIITATDNFNLLLNNAKPKISTLNLTNSTLNNTFTTPALLTTFFVITNNNNNNNNNTQVVTSLSDSALLAIILPIVITFLIACLIILSILIVFFKKRFCFWFYLIHYFNNSFIILKIKRNQHEKKEKDLAEIQSQKPFEMMGSLNESVIMASSPIRVEEIIPFEKCSLKCQTIDEFLEADSGIKKSRKGSTEESGISTNRYDKVNLAYDSNDKISSTRISSMKELTNSEALVSKDIKEPAFPIEIKIERSNKEAPIYENVAIKEIAKPAETSFPRMPSEQTLSKSVPTTIQIKKNYFLDFLHDFNLVFLIDDSSTMNEHVKRPIVLSSQSNPSKWDELKLIFGTLTEIVPNLSKSEIYLLDDKPMGMNSIDKLYKIVLANHNKNEKEENQMKNLLILSLTDVCVTHELNKSDNWTQTLCNLPSSVYTCIIDFSEDKQTNEYLSRLSYLLPNVTNDDLNSIRKTVEQQANTDPNKFRFDYADYLAKLLIRSACHLKL